MAPSPDVLLLCCCSGSTVEPGALKLDSLDLACVELAKARLAGVELAKLDILELAPVELDILELELLELARAVLEALAAAAFVRGGVGAAVTKLGLFLACLLTYLWKSSWLHWRTPSSEQPCSIFSWQTASLRIPQSIFSSGQAMSSSSCGRYDSETGFFSVYSVHQELSKVQIK